MKIDFHMPVKIISGIGCVKNNSKLFKLGSHALIVTGRHSAEKSGALADVTAVLGENGIGYTVYNEI
ncbi:MAG: iron-containing alcohol dehydrogenase, partial [Clostridia bacterium]|nr:iron-containing alcohol dehydrogenase [Clostridia bacterium]